MAGAIFADIGRARHAAHDGLAGFRAGDRLAGPGVHFCGNGLPDRLEFLPRGEFAAGHERRTETRAFLAAGYAGTDEAEAFFAQRSLAADRVGPAGIAAIDHDVALLQQRCETVDH